MASQQAAPVGDAGKTPAPRPMAQAMAAGLTIDKRAHAVGRHDGARGLPWQPPRDWNFLLDYALGYREDRPLRCEPLPAPGFDRWPALGARR